MFDIEGFFHKIIYGILSTIANIVDVLINFIRIVLGLEPLAGQEKAEDFLFGNLMQSSVMKAFGICILAAFSISLVFALVRVIKSHISEKDEEGVGVLKAIRGMLESTFSIVIIPIFAVAIIVATSTVATVIDNATRDTATTQVAYSTEVVFSAVDEKMLTSEGRKWFEGSSNYQIYDSHGNQIKGMTAVKLVYGGWKSGYYKNKECTVALNAPYDDLTAFKRLTKVVKEDDYFETFILPLLGSCVMLVALAMSSVTIAQRVFSVITLFILSPLPASFRALDDGARYKKWSEIFIGKVLSGYGIVFALNVFFSLAPVLTAKVYFSDTFSNGVAKLLIYIAGVAFAMGANVLVSQIVGGDSGTAERDQATQNFRAAMSGAHLAGSAVRTAGHLTSKAGRYAFGNPYRASADRSLSRTIGGAMPAASGTQVAPGVTFPAQAQGTSVAPGVSFPASQDAGMSRARQIGGAMGEAGAALAKGSPAKAAGSAAKNAGKAIGSSRIGRTVAGAAMLTAGLIAAPVRAVYKAGKHAVYSTVAKNTPRGQAYLKQRAQAKEQKAQAKTIARQEKFNSATPEKQSKMLAQSRKQAEKENTKRSGDLPKRQLEKKK